MSNITSKPLMTHRLRSVLLLLVVLAYTYLRFRHAFLPGWSLTNSGDGIGTIGLFAHFHGAAQGGHWLALLPTEQFTVFTMDGGLPTQLFSTTPWKIAYMLTTMAMPANDAYDALGMLAFGATLVSGFAVARAYGAPASVAAVAALLFANLDNLEIRLRGHLTLSYYFVTLAQLAVAHRFANAPSSRGALALGLVSALAFAQNEYYGYFGGIFAAVYIAAVMFMHRRERVADWRVILRWLTVAAVVFTVLMALLYPIMIIGRIFPWWFQDAQFIGRHTHPREDFSVFSVRNPLALFAPSIGPLLNLLSQGNPGEFTFRLGLAVPLFTLAMALAVRSRGSPVQWRALRNSLIALAVPCVVMALFAAPESRPYSLGTLTYRLAPMFRVGARAYLLIDLALVIAFAMSATAFLAVAWKREAPARAALALMCILAFADVSRLRPIEIPMLELPDRTLMQALRYAPQGAVLEVPAMPSTAVPEAGYGYLFDYEYHRKTIANPIARPGFADLDFIAKMDRAVARMNQPRDEDLTDLGRAGVRYIVVNAVPGVDRERFRRSPALELLVSDASMDIYRNRSYSEADGLWSRFVFDRAVYVGWEGCGQGYEKNGVAEHFCGDNVILAVTNLTSEAASGWLSCRTQGQRLALENRAHGFSRVSAGPDMVVPFALAASAGTSFVVRGAAGSPMVFRNCTLQVMQHENKAVPERAAPPTRG